MTVTKRLELALNSFLSIETGNNYCIFVYQPCNVHKVPTTRIDNEGRLNIAEKMEFVRQLAIREKFDYIFNVEHDNVVPKNALLKLIEDDKPIVGGIYRFRPSRNAKTPLMYTPLPGKDVPHERLQQVKLVPWGCTLFSATAFTKIPFTTSLDGGYTTACEKAGISRWIDFDVKVGHIDHESSPIEVIWP